MSVARRASARPLILALIAAMAIASLPGGAAKPVLAVSPDVVISEVYGGGGNSGATLTHDFIELFNRGAVSVSLSGWSVQYASSTGTSWQKTDLSNVSLAPGQAYLVQEAQGAGGTTPLPTPDATGTIAMSGTAGKVVLLNTATLIAAGVSCPTGTSVVDIVGYGAANCSETAPTGPLSSTTAAARTSRCTDTDNNSADFTVGTPAPQNTASPLAPCEEGDEAPSVASETPANGATNVPTNAPIRITFSEAVDIDPEAAILDCVDGGLGPTPDPKVFEFTYVPPLPAGATCSYTVDRTKIHDVDSDDPPDQMASDHVVSFTIASTVVVSTDVKISQIYGGGGNSGAEYRNDFIELFNRSDADVALAGWSVQYASAAGSSWQVTPLSGSIPAGRHYLIQEAAGNGGTLFLPDPDATGAIPMAAGAGKVALVASTAALSGACPSSTAILDLVGYGTTASCFEGDAPTPNLSNTTAALRDGDGAVDTDDNSDDFTVGAPNPRASRDTPPRVASTSPPSTSPGAIGVPSWANLTITFNEPVDVTGDWFSIGCATSGAHPATVSGGPGSFRLDPSMSFVGGESCTVTIVATNVTDRDEPQHAMAANHVFSFTVAPDIACGPAPTFIHQIQGSGPTSPMVNQTVEIQGVVVGAYPGANGFQGLHVQEEDADQDADPTTSEGIFIFEPNGGATYAVGDAVRIKGRVTEFATSGVTLTELTQLNNLVVCATGQTVTPANVTLPFASLTFAERFEGMLVDIDQELSVTETFTLGRFGEVVLSSGGRLITPTSVVAPGADAIALQAANDRNRIVLDDGDNRQNIDPTIYPTGGLSAANTLRIGDTTDGGTFVLEQRFGTYRLQPTATLPSFEPANPRPASPDGVGGPIKIASMNVLNYFTTLNEGSNLCGPSLLECRGANTTEELERQRAKILSALIALDADVVGLMEIENNDFEAVKDLVDGLNEILDDEAYDYIDTGTIGTDAIKVAFIYQPASATPVGDHAILDSTVDPRFLDQRNRPALAQTFESTATGGQATVIVNHLKSKGSPCDGDPDTGDGQGNCNQTRVDAAEALVDWIASDPTGSGDLDAIVIGDLNSYAEEDPIAVFEDAGYENMIRTFLGDEAYSFVFQGQSGYLDHALADATLPAQVTGTTEWHINADEPIVLDYNTEFKSTGHVDSLYAPTAYRSSDHDPVLVGANLLAYDFGGFQNPASAAGPTPVNPGQTLPVRFSLGGDRGLAVLYGVPTFQFTDCTSGAAIGSPIAAVAGEPFSYSPATDTYKFVWKTQKSWTGCGTLTVVFADGTSEELDVTFTK